MYRGGSTDCALIICSLLVCKTLESVQEVTEASQFWISEGCG